MKYGSKPHRNGERDPYPGVPFIQQVTGGPAASAIWGTLTGTLSDQVDLDVVLKDNELLHIWLSG